MPPIKELSDIKQQAIEDGRADDVPDQLLALASFSPGRAMKASHDLWAGFCHQHVQVGTAALPALPFILEVLDTADERLTVEILDILLGFTLGTNPNDSADFEWLTVLRARLLDEVQRFRTLAEHANAEIAEFAMQILEELPEAT